jgi:catalase
LAPSTAWKETVPEGEAARLEAHAEALRGMQRGQARGGVPSRALHAKGNAGVEAELTVAADVPAHAKVGIFAAPGTYRAYVRFSNGSGARQKDAKPDVRGVAVKVLGVPGKKLIPGLEGATTQDFLLIRTPATPVRDADEFLALVRAAQSPALLPIKLAASLGVRRTLSLLPKLLKGLGAPMTSVATTRYFSALPIQWGPYAAHYALTPHAQAAPGAKAPEDLGAELADRLQRGPVTYDLEVQFFVDAAKTPIEDASVEWREEDAPFVTVGRLTLKAQDPRSEKGKRLAERIETLSFDPWHAPVEFRPLGNMMRARNAAYRLSTQERKAAPEPDGTELA